MVSWRIKKKYTGEKGLLSQIALFKATFDFAEQCQQKGMTLSYGNLSHHYLIICKVKRKMKEKADF